MLDKKNFDEWEFNFIKDKKNLHKFSLSDQDAFDTHKDYNWVYDKHELYTKLEYPTISPAIVKPRTNLSGMGQGVLL